MAKKINFDQVFFGGMLIVPFILAFAAYTFFHRQTNSINSLLTQKSGAVAGITSEKKTKDLTNEVPIIPGSEISNIDTSNNEVDITLTTEQPKEEIDSYYEDYFYVNGWQQTGNNQYSKDNKTITYSYADKIIKLNLITK